MSKHGHIVLSSNLVNKIDSELSNYHYDRASEKIEYMGPIEDLNILVGTTNSGKSRFLRSLLKHSSLTQCANRDSIEQALSCVNAAIEIEDKLKRNVLVPFRIKEINTYPSSRREPFAAKKSEIIAAARRARETLSKKPNQPNLSDLATTIDTTFISNIRKNLFTLFTDGIGNQKTDSQGKAALDDLSYHAAIIEIAWVPLQDSEQRRYVHFEPRVYETDGIQEWTRLLAIISHSLNGLAVSLSLNNALVRTEIKRVYIPTLRSAFTLFDSAENDPVPADLYSRNIERFYKLGSRKPGSSVEIFTGLELYRDVDQLLRSSRREDLKAFEEFLSGVFFGNQIVHIVPTHPDEPNGKILAVRIGASEHAIHNFGDAVQAIIVLTYKLFTCTPGTWFFIEEPEINLHPGLQRVFVNAILENEHLQKKKHVVFITTHSNHLLDIGIPKYESVSIFSLERIGERTEKGDKFLIREVSNSRVYAISKLEALNSSVLMANCSIWVEGVTDRRYIRAYLDAYWKSDECSDKNRRFREDIHFAFFEYAGSNLSHYVFGKSDSTQAGQLENIEMQFIANRVFLIADRDEGKDQTKHAHWQQKQVERSKVAGEFEYFVTPAKEIENMLSSDTLKSILLDGEFRALPKLDSAVIRYEDYQVLRQSDGAERVIGLGAYLVETFGLQEAIRASSGTLSKDYKDKFARIAPKYIQWETMHEDSKELARRISLFIERHNPA